MLHIGYCTNMRKRIYNRFNDWNKLLFYNYPVALINNKTARWSGKCLVDQEFPTNQKPPMLSKQWREINRQCFIQALMLIHDYHIKHEHAHARNLHGYDDNMIMLILKFTTTVYKNWRYLLCPVISKGITSPIQPFQSSIALIKHHPVNKTWIIAYFTTKCRV